MTTNSVTLSLPSDRWNVIDEPFKGDVLKRQLLAQQLTGYLARLRDGAVIALDAPWGEGKTWFARHWAEQLRREEYRVVCIDAFENDYVEDPFLLLAAEVRRLISNDATMAERFIDRAAQVGKAIVPMATKMVVNFAGKALGTSDLAGEWSDEVEKAGEKGAEAAQALVKRRIEQHDKERNSISAFREELRQFAAAHSRPTVIVIDELDRCQPAFAVRMLERIKHYFDVPNLVFVLVMNRQQLEMAIKGVYGADTDASTYLSKFLNLSLTLPSLRSWRIDEIGHPIKQFVGTVLRRFKYQDNFEKVATAATVWALVFDLSLRDIERLCSLYFLSGRGWPGLATYLAAMKLKHPQTFAGFRSQEPKAYENATRMLSNARERILAPQHTTETLRSYFESMRGLLVMAGGSESNDVRQSIQRGYDFLYGEVVPNIRPQQAFNEVVQTLDFDVK